MKSSIEVFLLRHLLASARQQHALHHYGRDTALWSMLVHLPGSVNRSNMMVNLTSCINMFVHCRVRAVVLRSSTAANAQHTTAAG